MNNNQNNRNHRNNYNYRNNQRSQAQKISFYRVGQVFSLTYQISLLLLLYVLVSKGQQDMALKIFVINAGIVVLSLILSSIERVIYNAGKRDRRNHNRRTR